MTTTAHEGRGTSGAEARDLLTRICGHRRDADAAAALELAAVVEYAGLNAPDAHATDSRGWAATWMERHGGDTGESLAGEGAPDVSEFAVLHLAARVGMSPYACRSYVGAALEVAHRLPQLWAAVQAGLLPVWRARLVARQTTVLPLAGAREVDAAVAAAAHKVGPATLARLVQEALVRHDPDLAEERRQSAAQRRRVNVDLGRMSSDGIVGFDGFLDVADAYALELAVQALAQEIADAGCTEPLQVRRSMALGMIARDQRAPDPHLDLNPDAESDTRPSEQHALRPRAKRELVLHVHVSAAAVAELAGEPGACLARLDQVPGWDGFIGLAHIRDWCADPDTQIMVKPVIDLRANLRVDAYEIPDRIHDQVKLRDGTCRFPHCTKPARRCQTDHVTPYEEGGETMSDNLAPLCTGHHRLKTHEPGWTYRPLAPATYLWTSPNTTSGLSTPPAPSTWDPDRYRVRLIVSVCTKASIRPLQWPSPLQVARL